MRGLPHFSFAALGGKGRGQSYILIGPPCKFSILIGQKDVAKSSSALHYVRAKPCILIGQNPAEKFQVSYSSLIGAGELFF